MRFRPPSTLINKGMRGFMSFRPPLSYAARLPSWQVNSPSNATS